VRGFIGLILAFAIGFACRAFGIPSPAPPVIMGALLVFAMTVGYILVDRIMRRPALHAINCGGPSGLRAIDITGAPALDPSSTPKLPLEARLARLFYPFATTSVVRFIALLGLCAAYLQGGIVKLTDFDGAVVEAGRFGLPAASAVAIAIVITELAGSALILTGFYRWVGAIWLAGFTLIATFVANRFWQIPQPDRFMVENSFFEHLGLVGGFLLVAWHDLRQRFSSRAGANDGDTRKRG
jgi:XapX domain-containing protein